MKADFWHDMWATGSLGFHQADINEYLQRHWQSLGLSGDEQVLVPLCGKSLDMLWLTEQGHRVLGVELSETALADFVKENNLQAEALNHNHFCGYQLDDMQLFCGDFFKLSKLDCQNIKAVYDRAALVALPESMRQQYVTHLKEILPDGCDYLLVTMEYDQNLLDGPPFAVMQQEVEQLFDQVGTVELLEQQAMNRKGVAAEEKVYRIRFKD